MKRVPHLETQNMKLTERQAKRLYETARTYLRRMYPSDEISTYTRESVVIAAKKAMGGKVSGSDNAVVQMFVEWYGANVAPSERLVINRPYKHDAAMLASIARLTEMPAILSMNSRRPR